MSKHEDFEPLELELLHFSKYLQFDEEKEGISCPIAIRQLQQEKEDIKGNIKKKCVVSFIMHNQKIVEIIIKRLYDFDIDLFNAYMYQKRELRVIVYLFNTEKQEENIALKQFLNKMSSKDNTFIKVKNNIKAIQSIITFIGIIVSALSLYFVYTGLNAYGMTPQHVVGIPEISFLLFFTLLSLVVVLYIFLLLVFILLATIFWIISFCIQYFLYYIPVSCIIYKNNNLTKSFLQKSAIYVGLAFLFLSMILIVATPSISSTFTHDFSKHIYKRNYEIVIDIYQKLYSGYPKILTKKGEDGNTTYYVACEAGGYYYVYNIENVKKKYFAYLKKNNITTKDVLCKKKTKRDDFLRHTYIIDNPYIKPEYQIKRLSINDKNITLLEFNMKRMISADDINKSLCEGNMINSEE